MLGSNSTPYILWFKVYGALGCFGINSQQSQLHSEGNLDYAWNMPLRLLLRLLLSAGLTSLIGLRAATLTDARITEFLASNQDGIQDEDGDRSDWIEIWNSSGVGGDLGGWYLTDDPAMLTKWALPAAQLGSGEYLLVFASGKDRSAVPGEAHANFRLDATAGGYLALVKPDGTTIADDFNNYPAQLKDIAYGTGFETAAQITLLNPGANAKWHVPSEPVTDWNQPGFDDSTWSSGTTGIGYDNPSNGFYLPHIGPGDDLRSAMRLQNSSVYIRIPFEVTEPAGIADFVLSAQWEDGFIAYLNGIEIHRERAPETLVWNSRCSPSGGRSPETLVVQFADYPLASGNLVAGTNVLAIQGLNDSAGSSDFLFSPRFTATQQDVTNLIPGFFPDLTPGSENAIRYDGITADTKFSSDRGFYETAFDLIISSETAEATIRYTTDGSSPTETTGTVYAGPFNISETMVVRAIAFHQGYRPTNIDTHTYIFPSDVVTQPAMRTQITQHPTYGPQMEDALGSIPSIALTFQGNDVPANRSEIPVSVEMLNFESGSKQINAGVVRYGSYVTNFEKKSIRLHFRSEYGAKRLNYPLFDGHDYKKILPVSDFDALDIRAGNHDMVARGAYMSNRFTDDSLIDMGQVAPHGRFVHLYFNGQYRGQYHLRERWDASMLASYLPGTEEEFDTINANNTGSEFLAGQLQDGDLTEWNELRGLLNGASPYSATKDIMDVDDLIDFMLLWTSGNAESEFRAGGSVSNGVGFKFMIKDADGHLRRPSRAVTHNGPLNAMTRYRTEGDPDFKILLADQIHKHFFNGGAMTGPKLVERLQSRVDEVRLSYIAEVARWGVHNGNQTNRTPAQWEGYQNTLLNNTLANLTPSQMAKFRSAGMYPDIIAPVFSQHGGAIPVGGGVTMSTGATAIYYTLDGSDPRQPGGAISPGATLAPFEGDIPEPRDFVGTGANWSYLDDGSNQGTAWRVVAFDDSDWPSGSSELGYSEGDEATLIGFIDVQPETVGTQRNATTYFRHKVDISESASYSYFSLKMKYDDAAAVYINGAEVIRTANLSVGAAFDTYATSGTPNERTYFEFIISPSLFVDGENTIAVEIHNSSAGSSDISFDLRLRGEIDTSNGNNLTQPVILTGPAQLDARAYNSATSEWSALTSAFFSIGSVPASIENLVISEIHYHPAEPLEAGEIAVSTDRDDYEFIELLNIGAQPIELSGVNFSKGINFAFPMNTILNAGARAVLVRDASAFVARYGGGIEIAGEYSGRLSNDGELLTLTLTGTGDLRKFTFNDNLPWPTLPDGAGFSLVLIDPATNPDHALPSSWGTHVVIGGAPGQADAIQVVGYSAWKTDNNITDDNDDSDADGLSSFVEYALGTSPTESSTSSLPRPGMTTEGGDQFLTITFEKNPLANDIIFQLESSTDLETWQNEDAIEVSANTFRTATPLHTGGEQFLRLRISLR